MNARKVRLDAEQIKNYIHPYDFYLREQNISRLGSSTKQWVVAGLCPFHEDSTPGSFKANLENGAFVCFSCGAKGGDIISFSQKKYKIGFRQALEQLGYEWRVIC